MKRTLTVLATAALILTGSATAASAAPIPDDERDNGTCPRGQVYVVTHCEVDPRLELAGALSLWATHFANLAAGR